MHDLTIEDNCISVRCSKKIDVKIIDENEKAIAFLDPSIDFRTHLVIPKDIMKITRS